jgi:hypothetical protein
MVAKDLSLRTKRFEDQQKAHDELELIIGSAYPAPATMSTNML